MKKILFAVTLILLTVTTVSAQKKSKKDKKEKAFEGTVTYGLNFDGSNLPPDAMTMLNGAEAVSYIKGDKRRTELNMAIQSTTSIMDAKAKTVVTLMDIMGQKYLIRSTADDIKKEEADMPEQTIKYTDETKDIAGYTCKKAEVTVKSKDGKEETVNVYYTTEIPTSDLKTIYKGLNGFPMEYTVNQGPVKMTFTAKSVSKDPVPDNKFDIPTDGSYKEVTMDEFRKSMMQMGAGGQ